ncbi:pectate lyase-like adhesive domain-containing protein [Enterococcus sp. LJL90]
MKNEKKHWLRLINLIALLTLVTLTIVQLSSGAMEIFAAPKELSLSTEGDLTSLKTGDEFVVTISDSRDEGDIATTENTEVPYVDISGDITDAATASGSSSVTRQWTMTLPEGISFDEASETAMLKEADANDALPMFSYDEETRVLDITVGVSVTELDLKLYADTAGNYELSIADKNIMLTDSEKLVMVVGEAEVAESGVATTATANEASTDSVGTQVDLTQPPYSDDQTISVWNNPNIADIPVGSAYQEVYTWTEFNSAMRNSGKTYIRLMADIDNPSTLQGTGGGLGTTTVIPSRRLVVDGNNHKLNTQEISYRMNTAGSARNIFGFYLKDLTMYGSSPYGCFCTEVTYYKYIVYDNINYEGSQLTASYGATLIFKGTNTIRSAFLNYTYTIGSTTATVRNNGTNSVASGLEAHRAIFQEGSSLTLNCGTGDALIIGAYLSQNVGNKPYAYLEKGASIDLTSEGDGGESLAWNAPRVVNAGANIQNGGSLILEEDAKMSIDVSNTHRAGIRLTGGNSSRRTSIELSENADLYIKTGARLGQPWSTGSTGISNVLNTTIPYYSALTMDQYSDIDLDSAGANMTIDMNDSKFFWDYYSNRGYQPQAIRMDTQSNITVGTQAVFNVNMNGSMGSALRMVGSNSQFLVRQDGEVNINVSDQTGVMTYN